MARGPSYRVPFRRRREGKTNYRLRKKLVLSGRTRFVPRISLKRVTVQFIDTELGGDRVRAAADSKELAKQYGWLGGGKNVPAAYLTGLLAGLRALRNGVREAIVDLGLNTASKGSRQFAAVKGALDAGVKIPCGEEVLPSEDRIRGEHIVRYAEELSSDTERYRKQFSCYLKRGLRPESLPQHFEEVKARILERFRGRIG